MKLTICVMLFMSLMTKARPEETKPFFKVLISPSLSSDVFKFSYRDNQWGWSSALEQNIILINSGEEFTIPLKSREQFVYADLSFKSAGYIFSKYIVEAGDSIVMEITKDGIIYNGVGKEKYECRQAIENSIKLFEKLHQDSLRNLSAVLGNEYFNLNEDSISTYERGLKLNLTYTQKKREVVLKTLMQWRNKLTNDIFQRIKLDFISQFNAEDLGSYSLLYFIADAKQLQFATACKLALHKIYNSRKLDDFTLFDKNILALSDGYLALQFQSLSFQKLTPLSAMELISSKFSGLFRDRILTVYIKRKKLTNYNGISLHLKVLSIVKTDYCKKILETFWSNSVTGSEAYKFALPDTSGKIVKLNDLRGSVIILDFFFTGCSECRKLNNEMVTINDMYKGNPNVKFISVSIDKNLNEWKNSIKNNFYSHKGSIDLRVNGDDSYAAITKHYNVSGYPTMVIIGKDGKIIDSNPPRPRGNDNEKKLIAVIESALKY